MQATKEHKEGCADIILGFICLCLICAASSLWGGYVLQVLWAWFIAPTFLVAPLSLPAAMGIRIIVGLLTATASRSKGEKGLWEDLAYTAWLVASIPAFALLVGWIIQKWM